VRSPHRLISTPSRATAGWAAAETTARDGGGQSCIRRLISFWPRALLAPSRNGVGRNVQVTTTSAWRGLCCAHCRIPLRARLQSPRHASHSRRRVQSRGRAGGGGDLDMLPGARESREGVRRQQSDFMNYFWASALSFFFPDRRRIPMPRSLDSSESQSHLPDPASHSCGPGRHAPTSTRCVAGLRSLRSRGPFGATGSSLGMYL
jgi:hypothetical protein